jgi:VanZ family protein
LYRGPIPRLDRVSPYQADSIPGCDESRTNYLGSAMLIRSLLKYWVPVIGWTLLIFLASGDLMSAEHTSRFLVPFLRWFNPDISVGTLTEIHFCVRKAAHVTEYAILALLLSRAIFQETTLKRARSTLFVGAWIACTVVAMCDEFRQSFVESRGASPWDVMIDSAGAIFGLLLYARFARRRSARFSESGRSSPAAAGNPK